MQWGWPRAAGGFGGSALFRAVLGEELTTRGLVHSAAYSMTEVLGPAAVRFAAPELAAEVLPPLLRGDELWCQGFSEPDAGSDLGSLRTVARLDGDEWVISGQKLWTSWAHHASRCIVLARTEDDVPGSRGISAFFVDMVRPGSTSDRCRRWPASTNSARRSSTTCGFRQIDFWASGPRGGRWRSTSSRASEARSSGNAEAGSCITWARWRRWSVRPIGVPTPCSATRTPT